MEQLIEQLKQQLIDALNLEEMTPADICLLYTSPSPRDS